MVHGPGAVGMFYDYSGVHRNLAQKNYQQSVVNPPNIQGSLVDSKLSFVPHLPIGLEEGNCIG
jgi:hypothetical protein